MTREQLYVSAVLAGVIAFVACSPAVTMLVFRNVSYIALRRMRKEERGGHQLEGNHLVAITQALIALPIVWLGTGAAVYHANAINHLIAAKHSLDSFHDRIDYLGDVPNLETVNVLTQGDVVLKESEPL